MLVVFNRAVLQLFVLGVDEKSTSAAKPAAGASINHSLWSLTSPDVRLKPRAQLISFDTKDLF